MIYWIDTFYKDQSQYTMRSYDVVNHVQRNLGAIPYPWLATDGPPNFGGFYGNQIMMHFPFYGGPSFATNAVFDSINNKVLLLATAATGTFILMIYTPPTSPCAGNGSWSIDQMVRDRQDQVVLGGAGAVFIPELNAMVSYGGDFGFNFGSLHCGTADVV